ncbi:MAG: hypothetical protein ACO1NY_02525, partial [Pseudorhodoplanes sp.]
EAAAFEPLVEDLRILTNPFDVGHGQNPKSYLSPSWPGLSRPSTSFLTRYCKDVDARHKAGHDVVMAHTFSRLH